MNSMTVEMRKGKPIIGKTAIPQKTNKPFVSVPVVSALKKPEAPVIKPHTTVVDLSKKPQAPIAANKQMQTNFGFS